MNMQTRVHARVQAMAEVTVKSVDTAHVAEAVKVGPKRHYLIAN